MSFPCPRLPKSASPLVPGLLSLLIPLSAAQAELGDSWTWRHPVSPLGTGSNGVKKAVVTDSGTVVVGRGGMILVNGVAKASGTTSTLWDVAADGQHLVAAGEGSTIVTSSDGGATWSLSQGGLAGSDYYLTRVVRGGGKWIVSGTQHILSSVDGLTWTAATVPGFTLPYFNDLKWNGSQYLAAGLKSVATFESGIAQSSDGITWTDVSGAPPEIHALAWTGTRWVASGWQVFSSLNGLTWTEHPAVENPQTVFHSSGLTVVVAFGTTPNESVTFYTSPDGATWTRRNDVSDRGQQWNAMTSHGSTFAVAGENGTVLSSVDGGVTWTAHVTGAALLNTVYHAGGAFHAAGGDGYYVSSADGLTWQLQGGGTRSRFRALAWHDGMWVAGGRDEPEIPGTPPRTFSLHTSLDGVTWTDRSFDVPGVYEGLQVYAVMRAGNQWAAAAKGRLLTSPDAITWTPYGAGWENRALAWNGTGLLMAGGIEDEDGDSSGTVHLTSDGGDTWTWQQLGTDYLRAAVWTGTRFVVAGDKGAVYVSTTGAAGSWTRQTTGTVSDLRGLAWDPAAGIVAAGGNFSTGPVILTSPDGLTWTQRSAPGTQLLYSVARAGTVWIATGYDGTVLTSPDGAQWTARPAPTSHELYAGAWNGSEFLAAGEGGTILATGSETVPLEWVSIAPLAAPGSGYRLEWKTSAGILYHVEGSSDLTGPWTPLPGSPVPGTENTTSLLFTPAPPEPRRLFFRVRQ